MLVAVHIVYILRPLLLLLVVIVVVLLKHSLLIPVDYIQYITHYTTTTSTSYFLMRIARSTNWGVEVCLKTIIILPDCEMLLNSVVARKYCDTQNCWILVLSPQLEGENDSR